MTVKTRPVEPSWAEKAVVGPREGGGKAPARYFARDRSESDRVRRALSKVAPLRSRTLADPLTNCPLVQRLGRRSLDPVMVVRIHRGQ